MVRTIENVKKRRKYCTREPTQAVLSTYTRERVGENEIERGLPLVFYRREPPKKGGRGWRRGATVRWEE